MERFDDAIQAGSLYLPLDSTSESSFQSAWFDIESFSNSSLPDFARPEHQHVFSSLIQLSQTNVGPKANAVPLLRAEFKVFGIALIVRVFLLPWKGPAAQLKKASKEQLHQVMSSIVRRWDWKELIDGENGEDLVFANTDIRTISTLYQSIPSPSPSLDDVSRIPDRACKDVALRVLTEVGSAEQRDEDGRIGWRRALDGDLAAMGLRTKLYAYQRKSVTQMLIQEAAPGRFEDIKFVKMTEAGRHGFYYIDLSNGEVRRKCDVGLYDLPRGGILCEEMGTGKTLITLSLILATCRQRTSPDATVPHSPVITNVGLANSPSLRRETGLPPGVEPMDVELRGTLAGLALHRHLLNRSATTEESLLLPHSTRNALQSDPPFYYQYPERDQNCRHSALRSVVEQPGSSGKKIYLSSASLVIVPRLLIKQWEGEIAKHFENGSLKCISVEEELPDKRDVLDSDIILISDARFRNAEKELRLKEKEAGYFNIFTEIRWKRVIIDEGHVASTGSGGLMELARKTCSEAFWAVSGTPTKHALSSNVARDMAVSSKWSDEAIKDIGRLLGIFTNLLQMKPFDVTGNSIANSSTTLVINPLRGKDGPLCGAVERLAKLVNSVMVRNREEDIAADVQLPPLQEMKQALSLDRLGRLTYNVLQAIFAVNVVTSRRTGPDYLLSPESRGYLKLAFQNLQMACCWFPAGQGEEFDPKYALSVLAEYLQPEKLESFSEQDQRMMKEAEKWLSVAINDRAWQSLMQKISVPIYASQLPTEVLHASSHFVPTDDGTVLTSAEIILALRNAAADITNADGLDGKLVGAAISAKKRESQIIRQGRPSKRTTDNGKKTLTKNVPQHTKSLTATRSLQQSAHAATSDLREIQDLNDDETSLTISPTSRKRKRGQSAQECDTTTTSTAPPPLPREVRELCVSFNTLSSKLDWIVAEIVASGDDNFVVFGKDSLVLGQLTELLDIVGVSSCYVGIGLSDIRAREAAVDIFQHKMRRVCLMEMAMAGRGLNLVVANRVIFVEPVWQEDVERQAIARVHRIGQQRPTRCDILFIKGSPEQDVLEQRHGSIARDATDDSMIQNFIAHPKFIEETAPPRPPFIAPLVKRSSLQDEMLLTPPPTPQQAHRDEPAHKRQSKRARTRTPSPWFGIDTSASQSSVTAIQQDSGSDTLLGPDSPRPKVEDMVNVVRRRVAFQDQ